MRYEYNGYQHPEGMVELRAVTRRKSYSPRGYPAIITIAHDCTGEILATSNDANTRQQQFAIDIQNLVNAYGVDGAPGGLLNNDLSRSIHYFDPTDAAMLNPKTRVTQPPEFPSGGPGEYASFRTFSFRIEADYLAPFASELFDFQESVRYMGNGGSRFVMTELDTGPPALQRVSQFTPVTCIQSGVAIGMLSYPTAPGPIWSNDWRSGPDDGLEYMPPMDRAHNMLWPIRWAYKFQLPFFISATPHTR